AQVDSSVGGKVAIDLPAGKNLAGAFWQPKVVLMDPETLNTLEDKTFADGMAEVIKYGCIADKEFFHFLAAHPSRAEIMGEIEHVLYICCDIKRKVVERDEHDTGARMILNFGHTIGHAYELSGNYEKWTHGQAVAAGMVAAADLGVKLGVTPAQLPEQIKTLLSSLGLPIAIPCDPDTYAAAIGRDKKGAGGDISVILLEEMGRAVAYKMPKEKLLEALL
ncbi:MAG: 3-dehydroquinate synthase, partial [Oscillospiraceae bacterium]|nr:3-dehydroquinate synthase [Oscillospiraceae bacterium]